MRRLFVVASACAAIAGCASPEATRRRGGGPGGDAGNRPAQVKMHEGSRQYWKTPLRMRFEGPALTPSEQARRLSLPSAGASTSPTRPSNGGTDR